MKKIINIACIFIFIFSALFAIATDLTIGTDTMEFEWIRSGSAYYAICEDGISSKAGKINGATECATEILMIPDGAEVASVLIKSGTQGYSDTDKIAGTIGNASLYVNMSPLTAGLITNTSAAANSTPKILTHDTDSSPDKYIWTEFPGFGEYGTYNIPVGSNRAMKFIIDTAASIQSFSIIVRFDNE